MCDYIGPIYLNLLFCQYTWILEKAIMMDRSNAMKAIMALLNEDGLIIPVLIPTMNGRQFSD